MVLQLIKKFPAFHGTRKFITVLTSDRHFPFPVAWYLHQKHPPPPPPPPEFRVGEYFTSGFFFSRGKYLACEYFITFCFSWGGVVSVSPNPQAEGPPLVGCPRLLIQFIRSYPPYRRRFLHPQPEDAPCRGDRDPQTRDLFETLFPKISLRYTENIFNRSYQNSNREPFDTATCPINTYYVYSHQGSSSWFSSVIQVASAEGLHVNFIQWGEQLRKIRGLEF